MHSSETFESFECLITVTRHWRYKRMTVTTDTFVGLPTSTAEERRTAQPRGALPSCPAACGRVPRLETTSPRPRPRSTRSSSDSPSPRLAPAARGPLRHGAIATCEVDSQDGAVRRHLVHRWAQPHQLPASVQFATLHHRRGSSKGRADRPVDLRTSARSECVRGGA